MGILRRLGRIQVELIRSIKQCHHSDEWALRAASSLRGHYPITYFKTSSNQYQNHSKVCSNSAGLFISCLCKLYIEASSEGKRSEMAQSVWSCECCRTSLRRSTAAVKPELYHTSVTDYRGAATSHVHAMKASARCAAELLGTTNLSFFVLFESLWTAVKPEAQCVLGSPAEILICLAKMLNHNLHALGYKLIIGNFCCIRN